MLSHAIRGMSGDQVDAPPASAELHEAVRAGDVRAVKALAANAALLNQRIRDDAWEGLTQLEVAVKRAVRPVSEGDMR